MIRLSPAMTWSRHGGDIYVYGEDQVLQLPGCPPQADSLMQLMETGCDDTAVAALGIEASRASAILEALRSTNCLVENTSTAWAGTAVERQADYFCALDTNPDEVQPILADAHVAILGIGGIGSIVLAHLVSAGINSYTLIDGDIVQTHNLNRQLIYGVSDIGRCKVDAAADWITARNRSAVVHKIPDVVTGCSDLRSSLPEGLSLLVVAADSPADISLRAAHACHEAGVALVGADCGLRSASWGPLLEPADIAAYTDAQESIRERSMLPTASASMTASFGPTNAIVASYLAKDIVSWFAGLPVKSLRKKVIIDLERPVVEAGS